MSKTMTKSLALIVVALMMLTSVFCMRTASAAAADEGTWSAVNATTTTVAGNKISSGATAATNDYLAKYSQTINLADGFKMDFTVDLYAGGGTSAWGEITKSDNIAFALTGTAASSTAQKAYVFAFGKYNDESKPDDHGSILLYTCYSVDFKVTEGKVSYTSRDGGSFDNTTGNGSYDVKTQWVDGMKMSLAGDIVNGIPMFYTNDSIVNPMGDEAAWAAGGGGSSFQKYITDFYASFTIDTSAMHLYAFNTSAEGNESKFGVTVEDVTKPYNTVKNGWVATGKATADTTTANEVVFSGLANTPANSLPRTRFLYDGIIDLDERNIEFTYSTNKTFTPDWVTMISIRGVGIDQFTTTKSVGAANYEQFLHSGGATIGIYDDAARDKARGFGIHSTEPITITPATVEGDWATWTVRFEEKADGKFQYSVNGTPVAEYTRAQLEAVLGADMKAEIMIIPNEKAGADVAKYKLNSVTNDYYAAVFDKANADKGVSFDVTTLTGTTITKIVEGEADVAAANYTVAGNKVAFATSYLNALSAGVHRLEAKLGNGKSLYFKINVRTSVEIKDKAGDTTKGIKLFDKDITFTVKVDESDEIGSVTFNSKNLTFSAIGAVVIAKADLNKLHVGVYPVVVTSASGTAKFDITVTKVALQAPIWDAAQSTAISINSGSTEPLVLKVDVKDAADCYLTINDKELSATEAVFGTDKKTVTISGDVVKNLSIGNHNIALHTDGGKTGNITLTTTIELGDWTLDGGASTAPVKNDKGEILMTGSTTLNYKNKVDLKDGLTFGFLFGEVFDAWELNQAYVEFEITISQGDAKYLIYFRTVADGSADHNFKTVQYIQQILINGAILTNDVRLGEVPFSEVQTLSIKLLGETILTMFNHNESRENGMPVQDIGGQIFDQASVSVKFNTRSSKEHKEDTEGTLVSMGEFKEDIKKMPAWAKQYFLPALSAPVITVDGNKISWVGLEGAEQYIIYIGGEPQDIVEGATEFDFSSFGAVGDKLEIQVKAIGDKTTFGDSELSEVIEVTVVKEEEVKEPVKDNDKGCGSQTTAATAVVTALLMIGAGLIIKKKGTKNSKKV